MIAVRCRECRAAGQGYCVHNHVLVVYLEGTPVTIISRDEEDARLTANSISLAWRGRPFHRKDSERRNIQ